MATLVIGWSTNKQKNPMSWLIQKASGIKASHTYIKIYSDSLDRTLVYHASKHSIHFLSYKNFLKHSEIIEEFAFSVTDDQKRQVLQYCVDVTGNSYGWSTLIGIGIKTLLGSIGIKTKNLWQDGSRTEICAEVTYQVAKLIGMKDELNPENETLAPLYNSVKKFWDEKNHE